MSTKKVVITGANGRIGRRLVHQLVQEGHEVVGLVRHQEGAQTVEGAGGQALQVSLSDTSKLSAALSGAHWVFHLAGAIRGAGSETAQVVNQETTEQLITAVLESDRSRLEALVYTSTVAIYGDRSGLWVEEDMPPRPETDYARSKVAAEQALQQSHETHQLPIRIARLAAVYGPGFPFMMVDRIRNGRAWLPGEGMNFVPTIHVDDCVKAVAQVASAGENGRIYNLADRKPLPLKDFYSTVQKHAGGSPVRFWSTWIPSYVQERLARRNESIKARLGRKPSFTVDALRLFTASSRMNISRLENELQFEWQWPDPIRGIEQSV